MSSGVLLVYIGITLSDCPSVHMSCNPNSSLMDEPILMKLYTVYELKMCITESGWILLQERWLVLWKLG